MTNSMRWGLTSLTALGLLVAGVAFNGCSSSSSPPVTPEDTGTGDDSAVDSTTDTGTDMGTDSGTDSGADVVDAPVDTPPPVPDRKITIVHASPDAGPQLFCFGAGAANTLGKALVIGIPDASGSPDKYQPFPYGTIVPLSFPSALVSAAEVKALEGLTIYAFPIGATNPLTATANDANAQLAACKTAFDKFKGDAGYDTSKFITVPSGKILAGTSTILYATGCATPMSATPQCNAKPLSLGYKQLDLTAPTFPTSDAGTGANVAVHFFNASPFADVPSAMIPGWQNVDVWLFPMTKAVAGTDAGADADSGAVPSMPAGTPTMIASNVAYGDLVSPAKPFVLPAAADAASTLMVIMPHAATPLTPCVNPGGAPTATCSGWTLPLNAALAAFGPLGGGFVDKSSQLLMIAGAPIPDPSTGKVTIGFGNVTKP